MRSSAALKDTIQLPDDQGLYCTASHTNRQPSVVCDRARPKTTYMARSALIFKPESITDEQVGPAPLS